MKKAKETRKQKKLFIIEDDPFLLDLLIRRFKESQFEIMTAGTAEEAFVKIEKDGLPDAILLDLVLPGVRGYEVLRRLKKNPKYAKIPVIILSNLGQEEEIQRGLDLGADSFLIKAKYTPDEILDTVMKTLFKEKDFKAPEE